MEVRIYAEDPLRNFQPSPGTLTEVVFPDADWVRVDGWISSGSEVSPHYDPMLAKLIVHGTDRADALGCCSRRWMPPRWAVLPVIWSICVRSPAGSVLSVVMWLPRLFNSFEFAPNAM